MDDTTIAEETPQQLEPIDENKEAAENKPVEPTEPTSEQPAEESANKVSEEVMETEKKDEENKTEEETTVEVKTEEKTEETVVEETSPEEVNVEETKAEETKTEEVNNNNEEDKKKSAPEHESKSVKGSTVKLNDKESKSTHGSKNKINGSEMNLSQKKRTSKEILNKFKSKSNIYGSISNLRNSKNSLYGSRTLYGSSMVLNKNHHFEQNQEPTDRITFENTYQLKPTKKFSSYEVKKMLDELLKKKFITVHQEDDDDPETIYFQYETKKAQEMSKELANEILEEVKKFEYDRYKLVVDVTIGEYTGQGVRISSRAIWDTSTDSYASSTYRHGNVFVTAIVFGCYYE